MAKRMSGEQPMPEGGIAKEGKKVPEKKESKLEGLEKRVLLLRDFYKAITAIRADLSIEETATELDRIFQNVFEKFPTPTKNKFRRHQKDLRRFDELKDTAIDPFFGKDIHEMSAREFNELKQKSENDTLLREREKLEIRLAKDFDDFDLLFLLEVGKMIMALKQKKAQVEKFRTSPEELSKFVSSDKIVSVFFEAFSVSVIVAKEFDLSSSNDRKGLFGQHFIGMPVNLIKERDKDGYQRFEEETIRHENIHNFLDFDSQIFVKHYFLKIWKERMDRYLRLLDLNASEFTIERERQLIRMAGAEDFIDEEHEEILAAMENAENLGFQKTKGLERIFLKGVPSLSTAQFRVKRLIQTFLEKAEVQENDFLKDQFKRMSQELDESFAHLAELMKFTFEISRRLGSEADEFAHFAFVLLKPSQFGAVEALLRQRYGQTEVERVKQEFLFVKKASLSPEYLMVLLERVRSVNNGMKHDDFLTIFEDLIGGFNAGLNITLIGIKNFGEAKVARQLLQQLGELCLEKKWPVKNLKDIESRIYFRYFKNLLESFQFIEPEELPEELKHLTPEETKELVLALEDQADLTIRDLAEDFDDKEITMQDVYQTTFWKILELIGVEERFRPLLERKISSFVNSYS